ncbi:hypothetical protein HNR03_000160 [Pseudomonas sp. JAI111]|nr:hypothetical protein [Pseudomonas sp. JAI111]
MVLGPASYSVWLVAIAQAMRASLLGSAHCHSQQAGGDWPNTRYAQQTLAQIIVGKLAKPALNPVP